MPNLDLISQVLFVALMAMFLFVLYRRFLAMMMKGRITGSYARVVSCRKATPDSAEVRIDSPTKGRCVVRWEGGDPQELTLAEGEQVYGFNLEGAAPDRIQFDFGNQQVVRLLD